MFRMFKAVLFVFGFICVFNSCKKKAAVDTVKIGSFKVLSYNIYEGFRADPVNIENFKKWVDTLKPDVVAFQEMKGFTKASLQSFAKEMGFPYSVMHHEAGLPVALISKYGITDIKAVPSNLHLIQAKILDYHFFVVHLSPLTYGKRLEEIAVILNRTQQIPQSEKVLLMGDLNNMSPQDASFYDNNTAKMELVRASEINNPGTKILNNGKIDYETIQNIIDAGFYDSWKMFRSGYDKSAPTKLRSHGNFTRIDYIWMSKSMLHNYKDSYLIKDSFTDYLSDHYPMVLVLKR